MTTCYSLSNSLPPVRREMLVSFQRIAEEQGVPFLLVGATVLHLILTCRYDIKERRKTYDLDFGVMLPDWDCYKRLAHALETSGGFRQNMRRPHEFRYGANWIDLVPFGSIGQNNAIAWPPERASIMNIVGYEDVFRAAVEIDFGQDTRIKSASLPGIVLLKLFAWNDRPERAKDLVDTWLLMENYFLAGEVADKLHTEHPYLLNLPAEKFENLVGARILGRDLASLCSRSTHKALKELLERECEKGDQSKILLKFEEEAKSRGVNESFDHVNTCWKEFVKGCLETTSGSLPPSQLSSHPSEK